MKKINFEDGQLVTAGYVEIDGVQHNITEAVYEGETPLSSLNLNNMQDNIEEAINEKANTTTATQEADGLMSKEDKIKVDNMPNVIDSLESESVTDVLSANMGKVLNENKIEKSTSIKGVDIDTIDDTGFYYCNACTNVPSNGYLFTQKYATTFIYQKFIEVYGNGTYERFKTNGTWGEWRKITPSNIIIGTEFETGRIIEYKKEYGKRINFGALPNSTSKSVAHNIIGATKVTGYQAFANNANGIFGGITLPRAVGSTYIELQITSANVFISSNYDASAFNAEVEIYYVK